MRILSIPGRHHENSFFAAYLTALEQQGCAIVSPRRRNLAWFAYDVLHLNFPTHQITENGPIKAAVLSLALGMYLVAARLLGRTIVYTVHDVVPFKLRHGWLLWSFLRLVHGLAHGFIFLSASSREAFAARYARDRSKPWVLIPHGPYPTVRLSAAERLTRRQRLIGPGDGFIVGFLGAIKPYKNIGALRDLPARTANSRLVHVVVAGRVEAGHEAEAEAAVSSLPPGQVTRIAERLQDDELDRWMQTVDVALLPYVKGSNSGAAILVLSNHGRLIGSDLPVFAELARVIGPPWVYHLDPEGAGPSDYLGLIEQAARDQPSEADRVALDDYLRGIGWPSAARSTCAFYGSLRNGRRSEQINYRPAS